MLNERDVLAALERKPIVFPPLRFERLDDSSEADGIYRVMWSGQGYKFVANVKARATSQALAAAAQRAKSNAFDIGGSFPLVIVPYLSPSSLDEVERLGISAVDLCGNGVVQIPQQWIVFRSGRPNQFRGVEPLRGVYRGTASLVPRAFVVRPTFNRVGDVQRFIEERGGRITLATVSKALSRLEEDLVIARDAKSLRLIQADKLLSKLREGYQPPVIRTKLSLKSKLDERELTSRLSRAARSTAARVVRTGMSSAARQTVFAAEPMTSFYCSSLPDELARAASLDPSPQRHFADIELLQTDDERVFFDARNDDAELLASPIQTWLELATGDKRSQEVADDVHAKLLAEVRPLNG